MNFLLVDRKNFYISGEEKTDDFSIRGEWKSNKFLIGGEEKTEELFTSGEVTFNQRHDKYLTGFENDYEKWFGDFFSVSLIMLKCRWSFWLPNFTFT